LLQTNIIFFNVTYLQFISQKREEELETLNI
jgi:hypothetical protein